MIDGFNAERAAVQAGREAVRVAERAAAATDDALLDEPI
jgi:hypothetical protein